MTNQISNSWSPNETNKLIRLWSQGASAGTIAKELANKTRNAVIGKAKRLGLYGNNFVLVKPIARSGQAAFRKAILHAYSGQCCMTGNDQSEVLEAAHISPYNVTQNNDITNGLCLRSDMHSLFDCGLVSVDSNYTILISKRVTDIDYRILEGSKISTPHSAFEKPSVEFLRWHNENIFKNEDVP